MDDFCSLSRYAPEDIDTDAKRKDKFLCGLKGELKIPLSVAYAPNYQALLDQAVTLDNNIRKEEFVRGSTAMTRPTLDIPTRDPTPMEAMERVTSMAIGTMVETMETTLMIIIRETMEIIMEAVDIPMEEMDNTTPNR
jgi:hypothetical protein